MCTTAFVFQGCTEAKVPPAAKADPVILYPIAQSESQLTATTSPLPNPDAIVTVAGVTLDWSDDLAKRTDYSPLQPILFRNADCSQFPSESAIDDSLDSTTLTVQDEQGDVPYFVTQSESPDQCIIYPMRIMRGDVTVSVNVAPAATLTFTVSTAAERTQWMTAAADLAYTWLENTQPQFTLNKVTGDHFIVRDSQALAAYTGSFTVPNIIAGDRRIHWQDGKPIQQGTVQEFFQIYAPNSVTQATSVPIVQYGHGLFGDPAEVWYGSQGAIRTETQGIFGAIAWGMSVRYFGNAIAAIWDPNQLGVLQDRNIQSNINKLVFGRWLRDAIAPQIANNLGVTANTELDYVGISQGGILGSPLLATSKDIRRAVMHVGGGSWTPMMTHSSNWVSEDGTGYGEFVRATVPTARHRAMLYAVWQNFWDWWDPALFAPYWLERDGKQHHPDRRIYYPYAIDDPQVPNFSSELVMRGASVPLVGTAIVPAPLIETVSFGGDEPILASQWDVGGGEPAHSDVRKLPAFARQVATFIQTGEIVDTCAGDICQFLP